VGELDVNPEDWCPAGGGHAWTEVYENDKIQVLKCRNCGRDSVGYYFNPWEDIE